MTLFLEVGAAAAAFGAYAHNKTEKYRTEECVSTTLYSRYFHADLLSLELSNPTTFMHKLPEELHPIAASCVQIVEAYQKDRKKWFLGFSSSSDFSGDIRTIVLEELKQWLLTVSEHSRNAAIITTRLEYCQQFLLRPSVFPTTNDRSFLNTMAQVSAQLERLLKDTIANQHNGIETIGQILSSGLEIVEGTLAALVFVLPGEDAIPGRAKLNGTAEMPDALGLAALCSAAKQLGAQPSEETAIVPVANVTNLQAVNWGTDAGFLLQQLLSTPHTLGLCQNDAANLQTNALATASSSSNSEPVAFLQSFDEVKGRWSRDEVTSCSGLGTRFRGPAQLNMRLAHLDVCWHLDRIIFFLATLRPYHHIVGMRGDIAMCWLRSSLGHLMQELERALLHLRQSRLELMRAAKLHLQDLAKHLPRAGTEWYRWMQGLRHIDETRLDDNLKAVLAHCAEVRTATTVTREAELGSAARQGLKDVAAAFSSVEFQARCSPALRKNLDMDMKKLTTSSTQDGSEATPMLQAVANAL